MYLFNFIAICSMNEQFFWGELPLMKLHQHCYPQTQTKAMRHTFLHALK